MRENEARPPAGTATPVISDIRIPGGVANPAAGAGGRSGASPTTPAPAGERRRAGRSGVVRRGLFGVLHAVIGAIRHLSPVDRGRVLTGVLLVAALSAILLLGDRITDPDILLFALVSAALLMIVGKGKDGGIRQAGLIFAFAIAMVVIRKFDTDPE